MGQSDFSITPKMDYSGFTVKMFFTTKCAMSLRSSTEHENGGISLHRVLSSTRHSRARGNPGLLRRISLDTRFRGYDGPRRPLRSHPLISIFEGRYRGHEDGRGWRIEDRRSQEEFAILNLPSSILDPCDFMSFVVNKVNSTWHIIHTNKRGNRIDDATGFPVSRAQ